MTKHRAVAFLLLTTALAAHAAAADPGGAAPAGTAAEAGDRVLPCRIERTLPEVTFEGVAFADAVEFLGDVTNANFFVNWRALEAAGVGRDRPLRLHLRNKSFRKSLALILDAIEADEGTLDYDVRDGVIVLSTTADLGGELEARTYDVPALAPGTGGEAGRRRALHALVSGSVAPGSWEDEGGRGTIETGARRVVVTQRRDAQAAISNLFTELGALAVPPGAAAATVADGDDDDDAAQEVAAAPAGPEAADPTEVGLGRIVPEVAFDGADLSAALDQLGDVAGQRIVPNWAALKESNIGRQSAVTLRLKEVPVGVALRLLLDGVAGRQGVLGHAVENGNIVISTRADLDRNTLTRVYDVRDFLGGPNADDAVRGRRVAALTRLITGTVAPASWRDAGGSVGAARELQGQLIVTQSPGGQAAIRNLLLQARAVLGLPPERAVPVLDGDARPEAQKLNPDGYRREFQGKF